MIRNTYAVGVLALAISCISAAPALAQPHPSPVAPEHTGTGCVSVLTHNPQTGPGSHQAPPAEEHFAAVGAAMCGL